MGKQAFLNLFAHVSVSEWRLGVDGGWVPLPTRYCDPVSLVSERFLFLDTHFFFTLVFNSDKETRAEISRPRYGSPFPWPLNHILAYRKQFDVKNHLKAVGWFNKTLDQVYEDVHVGLQVIEKAQCFGFGSS